VRSLTIGALLSLVPVAITNGPETGLGWLNVTSERSLLLLTRQAEPPTLVTNESDCYHFRVLDPRVSANLSATMNVVTIGHCSHS
jgi:hypothetical protein